MKPIHLVPIVLTLVSSQAFAWAYSGTLSCTSNRSQVSIPFSNSTAAGFDFEDGATMNLGGLDISASVITRNNLNTLVLGPSLFTLKAKHGAQKIGFVVETREAGQRVTVPALEPRDKVKVEIFNEKGQSLGFERAHCRVSINP